MFVAFVTEAAPKSHSDGTWKSAQSLIYNRLHTRPDWYGDC